jgi:hypothetical protein
MRNEASFPFYVDYHCPHTSYYISGFCTTAVPRYAAGLTALHDMLTHVVGFSLCSYSGAGHNPLFHNPLFQMKWRSTALMLDSKKIETAILFLRPNNPENTTCRRGILASRHHTPTRIHYTSPPPAITLSAG